MAKKKKDTRRYKAYEFKNKGKIYPRVKGPGGFDVHIDDEGCAGCTALYMNIAYEAGRKSCQ